MECEAIVNQVIDGSRCCIFQSESQFMHQRAQPCMHQFRVPSISQHPALHLLLLRLQTKEICNKTRNMWSGLQAVHDHDQSNPDAFEMDSVATVRLGLAQGPEPKIWLSSNSQAVQIGSGPAQASLPGTILLERRLQVPTASRQLPKACQWFIQCSAAASHPGDP